jgi:hypothetical protein
MIFRSPGHRPLTTHICDRARECIDSDAVVAVEPSLLREFVSHAADDRGRPDGIEGPWAPA